ncbi:MAG: hypothetical protein IPF56_07840 [Chloroflexi bacterium]|nr:hypothetical protein [Chloroflexota bacterium]MBK6709137.1 hypothetical protein [Chloroflexota bacterium]MBK7175687.1 hypothetical protein [Chloroflexota bacterium]MBK7914913.1 hypothetical protein [Chloroflexota bacterium]MBK8935896.1 hypothetical protein [Chloroflexota bacterium]
MKIFIGFIIFAFIGGLLMWKLSFQRRSFILLGVCVLVGFAYYFLNQL